MLLRSPLAPNLHTSSSSTSSETSSDESSNCKHRYLGFLRFSKSQTPLSISLSRWRNDYRILRSRHILRSCRASAGNASHGSDLGGDDDDSDRYLQALLLVPETVRHYNLWKQGFIEETKWHSDGQKYPFSSHRRGGDFNLHSIGHGVLRRFQTPTVFLKIACDGNLFLPIIVGEFAIIRLIDAIGGEEHEECPDLFQFVNNFVRTFGYEVTMVRITDRVVNTYYARIFLRKAADDTNITIDARPSDALNVAERFKAPIYVSKEIVVKDAIKLVYGSWRGRSTKMVYDVSLDSAPDGPDRLVEELDVVQKLNEAVLEERFEDAAFWRDKLARLRMPGNEL